LSYPLAVLRHYACRSRTCVETGWSVRKTTKQKDKNQEKAWKTTKMQIAHLCGNIDL